MVGGLGFLVDGWKVQEMVGRFGRPLGDLGRFHRRFPSIQPQTRPLQDVVETYKIHCISIGYSQEKNHGFGGDTRLKEGG